METVENLFKRFEQLNEIGAALSNERNIDRLLENILLAAKTITHADGGTLYRMSEDRQTLHFAIVRTDSLGIAYGGTTGQPISFSCSKRLNRLSTVSTRLLLLDANRPHLFHVGHPQKHFLDAVHLQGPHALVERRGEQFGNAGVLLDLLLQRVGPDQQLMQADAPFVPAAVASVAPLGAIQGEF